MRATLETKAWLAALVAATVLSTPVFAAELPSDQRIKQGKLKNGVTWMYRQHDNPPGKMALMMHVRTGSLNETDEQRGLAHFIEHMCFNGTDNFAPGELIPYFESIGMEFGADLNAFTSFDQTAYMLFTPDTEKEQIDKALMVLSDYAFRVLMLKEEIDKERGVVLEESRSGKSAFQRIRDKVWPELFEGTRFAERLPIGKDEILENAPRKEFVDYYKTWYRPENITLVMVGDADYKPFIPIIEKWFAEHTSDTAARTQKGPEFTPFTKQRTIVATDPEMAMCDVQLLNILPGRPPTTTVDQFREDLVESIGGWIMGRRYDEMVNKGEASFRGARAGTFNFFNDALLVSGSANGEPEDWYKMLEELIIEINRAREFGFTARELELAKKEIKADAEHSVKTEPTRNARGIARGIVRSVNDKEPYLSAQQELDLYDQLLPSIDLAEVSGAFKKHFAPGTFAYVIEMVEKEDVAVPSRDDVMAAAKAAWARKVEPIKEVEAPTDLLATLPTPGEIAESKTDEELGITSAWLSNGIRVHHRFMDYKKDSVLMSITLAGGSIEETPDNAGVTDVSTLAFSEAATSRLTSTNMRDIMTGTNISVGAGSGGDGFHIRVSGSPEDLEIGLQKAYALLTDGIIEDSAFDNWKKSTLQQLDMAQRFPGFKAQEAFLEILSGGDPRLTMMTKERVEQQSVARSQQWFNRIRREAPIEVAIVGDIKLDVAMPLVQRYLGSLPKRPRTAQNLNKLRKLPRATGPWVRTVKVETMTPQAMAMAGFLGCEGRNTNDRRALSLARNVLSSRLVKRIREELSIVYSIGARQRPSWVYQDSGTFMASSQCDPENVNQVVDEVHKMFQDFADNGPTEEELANAKKQILENLDTEMREPRWWFGILRNHDLHGRDYHEAKTVKEAYQKYTAGQIQKTFAKYYTPERRFKITAVPVKPEASEGGPKIKKESVKPSS